MARLGPEHEVREDLADHARELEAVARARGRDDHVRMIGEAVDDEVRVRRVRVHTHLGLAPSAVGEWHPPAKPRAYALLVAWGRVSIDGVGIRRVAEVKPRDLDSLTGDVREAVEDPVRVLNDVDRQARRGVTLPGRHEPKKVAPL